MSLAAVSCTKVHSVTGNKYKFAQVAQKPVAIGYKFGHSLTKTFTCYSKWCLLRTMGEGMDLPCCNTTFPPNQLLKNTHTSHGICVAVATITAPLPYIIIMKFIL